MKKAVLFLSLSLTILSACNTGDNKKSAKGNWTQENRKDFMSNCVSSAKKSYESRGQQPDSTIVITMCKCSGEIIEEKYAYADADKIAPDEIKGIMEEAAKKCLTKK